VAAQSGTAAGGTVELEFSDAAGCKTWLERLPAANLPQSHAALASQVELLASAALPAASKLELLELLRETVSRVQGEQAKQYLGRPVPLDDDERAVWEKVVAVWNAMAAGYDSLIDAMAASAPEIAGEAPLICQRALRYTGLAMSEYSRVYRNVPAALWKQLHRLYVFAENAGAQAAAINDPAGRAMAATSCAATYVHALLMQLSQPDALSVQHMSAVELWLERWESIVTLSPVPIASGAIPALAVDLASERGAALARELPAAGVRHLNLEGLSKTVRQAAAALRQGQTPAQLGLSGLSADAAEKLLMLLHIQWCAAGTGRMDERNAGGIVVTIAPNLAAIHYQVTGRAFKQPGAEITARERQSMDMMGLISEATDRAFVSQRSATIETWVIVNKSASGFLGMCRDPNAATHINHNQLLGLRNPTNKQMYLGTVQRLVVDDGGAIWIGLRLITGMPQAVAARMTDARGPDAGKFDRALLVAEDAGRKVPASILLMPGWYGANRQLDLQTDRPQPQKIRLQALLDKGPNFERATYTVA
jgi:cyclic-di-GMP-binding protein